MQTQLILSVLSDDKPGVVSAVASVVTSSGGNWLDCRLTRLGGKFTGVICITLNATARSALEENMLHLRDRGIRVIVDDVASTLGINAPLASFNLVGPDRTGLVLEISQAFSERGINVVELTTECTSMPYSGEPLFSAEGVVELPQSLTSLAMEEMLERIANDLGMDFTFSPTVEA